jgi:hypothetical protein
VARVLAVIHHDNDALSMRNAAVARAAGCAGVVLIQMDGRDHLLDTPAVSVKRAFPELLVGTNRLSMTPDVAVLRDAALGLDATWSDDPGVTSTRVGDVARLVNLALETARRTRPQFKFFGSVAFKTHLVEDPDPGEAARRACRLGWVATTSGPATGVAPDVRKLRLMRKAIRSISSAELALASGVAPANAPILAPFLNWVLVSTGISVDFHTFDPGATRAVVEACARAPRRPGA